VAGLNSRTATTPLSDIDRSDRPARRFPVLREHGRNRHQVVSAQVVRTAHAVSTYQHTVTVTRGGVTLRERQGSTRPGPSAPFPGVLFLVVQLLLRVYRSRTARNTGPKSYGSEGKGFESLRARSLLRLRQPWGRTFESGPTFCPHRVTGYSDLDLARGVPLDSLNKSVNRRRDCQQDIHRRVGRVVVQLCDLRARLRPVEVGVQRLAHPLVAELVGDSRTVARRLPEVVPCQPRKPGGSGASRRSESHRSRSLSSGERNTTFHELASRSQDRGNRHQRDRQEKRPPSRLRLGLRLGHSPQV
jgi:hypothetical protein